MNKEFTAWLYVDGEQKTSLTNPFKEDTLAYAIFRDNPVLGHLDEVPAMGFDSSKEQAGLYTATDMNGGTTYVFRGTNVNNYILMNNDTGAFPSIMRISEDGQPIILTFETTSKYGNNPATFHDSDLYNKIMTEETNTNTSELDGLTTSTWCFNTQKQAIPNIKSYGSFLEDQVEEEESTTTSIFGIYNRTNIGITYAEMSAMSEEEMSDWEQNVLPTSKIKIDMSCAQGDRQVGRWRMITPDEFALAGGGAFGGDTYITNIGMGSQTLLASIAGSTSNSKDIYRVSYGQIDNLDGSVTEDVFLTMAFPKNIKIASGNGTQSLPYRVKTYS